MAISTFDGFIAGEAAAQPCPLLKSVTPQAAGCWMSLFTTGGIPGAAADPSSGVGGDIPTDATAGAVPFTNSNSSYLGLWTMAAGAQGTVILFDRLWHNSGLSPTTTGSAQTVNSTALTRPDANGNQAEAWFQVFGAGAMGAGSTAPTISYTNPAGTASRTGTLLGFATTAAAHRTFPFQLDSGDTGVKSIQTYTNGATMTSGSFGLVIRRRIATIALKTAFVAEVLDGIEAGMPRIYDDACLEMVYQATATAAIIFGGDLRIAQG